MSKTMIDKMVDRFLGWKLPKDFSPDAGISFKADYNEGTQWPMKHEPIGTNLFNADQAREMFKHCVPDDGQAQKVLELCALLEKAEAAMSWPTEVKNDEGSVWKALAAIKQWKGE